MVPYLGIVLYATLYGLRNSRGLAPDLFVGCPLKINISISILPHAPKSESLKH